MPRLFAALSLLAPSGPALAGMPTVTLSDLATSRFQAISFFLVVLLLVALAVKVLWNFLRRDFPRLPRLSYRRAVAFVVLLGLVFDVVLLMIAGTREIMTPEAWEKQGAVYRLKDGNASEAAPAASESPTGARAQ